MATTEFSAHLVGVTLSTEQLEWAQQRMVRTGVAQQAELRLQDYRDIKDGPFDAICSIEMLEAVGQEFWPDYFATVSRLLKPGGRACIQSIVIDDSLFARYLKSTDFIQQYIFPGGCLPSPGEFQRQAEAAGLKVVDQMAFGPDYAETLRRWRRQFLADHSHILQLGFDERFIRLWEFYLVYCEAAFDEANIDVIQFTLQKE
jgi:cyclopropane-fatty-acyl-phospholipid synthase